MATTESFDTFLQDYVHISKFLNTRVTTILSPHHLTLDTFLIMHAIGNSKQPILLMEIANQRNVSRSAISRQISLLLDYNYICQKANPNDRRKKGLLLTEEGHKLDAQLSHKMQLTLNQWRDQFGKQRVQTLLTLLRDFDDQVIEVAPTPLM
ncbi:MarR family winged helix-turn-helix transcriptional regulator [Lactiplantibacillus herbarum]|uniref:MarR family winged helix-turn-helix transcriptional regulator n=1 Tax=Lactiplantibacillus herbarum TaxID=1670446 RepID=UPI00064FD219|nr:MarR family transcriptional regulator [Lactiplantibacillus herbarum]